MSKDSQKNTSPASEPETVSQSIISTTSRDELLRILEARFIKNADRHPDLTWSGVLDRLEDNPDKIFSLNQMEATGGEPDVYGKDRETGEILFVDFSKESPIGRRSLCYDHAARVGRKANQPESSAEEMAASMGIELLTEKQYRLLQALSSVDEKTSSWLKTPPEIRSLGGAIFGDFRYGRIFIYHNGAESYYGVRGFRGMIRI